MHFQNTLEHGFAFTEKSFGFEYSINRLLWNRSSLWLYNLPHIKKNQLLYINQNNQILIWASCNTMVCITLWRRSNSGPSPMQCVVQCSKSLAWLYTITSPCFFVVFIWYNRIKISQCSLFHCFLYESLHRLIYNMIVFLKKYQDYKNFG